MKIIKQTDIKPWLKQLATQAQLLVPARVDKTLLYTPYQENLEVAFEGVPRLSAKGLIFPQTQTLLDFKMTNEEGKETVELNAPLDIPETVVFGLRPCDAHGIAIIEQVFTKGRYQDPYFKQRRQRTTLIAVSCCEPPAETCFCPSVGGSPTGTTGVDLLLTKVGDNFLAEPLTHQGEKCLVGDFFQATAPEQESKLAQVKQKANDKLSDSPNLGDKAELAKNLEKIFMSDYWQQTASACLGCNVCTYLCPTCHCFNITDEMGECSGKRIRTWDGCLACQYTLEASGHNPRNAKFQRYRNRINHKFSYLIKNFGVYGCVGCGRCIRHCPVSLDIREVVKKAAQAAGK